MRYKLLGNSGLRVSELCLGTMTFGNDWGWGADHSESQRMFEAFAQAGGNFIDTANAYTNGTSESFLGEFMGHERDRYVLATKYTGTMFPSDPNGGGNHRKSLRHALEGSLRRLGTDYIDLLWVHMWDFMTPIEEVMRSLDDMVRAGKVLYVGISDTPAWIVSRANTMAEMRGWTPFTGLQLEYSLAERTPEREQLPMARQLDLGVTAWSPLASGILSGKYNRPDADQHDYRLRGGRMGGLHVPSQRNLDIASKVMEIGERLGRTPSQVALRWVLQRGTMPILGARKLEHIRDNLACLDFEIPEAEMQELNQASHIDMGFPHDFLSRDLPKGFVFGKTRDRIHPHR